MSWTDKQQAILDDFKSGRQDDETAIRRLIAIGMTADSARELIRDLEEDMKGG